MRTNVMLGQFLQVTLTDENAVTLGMIGAPIPCTVWVNPTEGDTINVWISFDGGTSWQEWEAGEVTVMTSRTLNSGVTAIKFQRTVGTSTTSTCGVC